MNLYLTLLLCLVVCAKGSTAIVPNSRATSPSSTKKTASKCQTLTNRNKPRTLPDREKLQRLHLIAESGEERNPVPSEFRKELVNSRGGNIDRGNCGMQWKNTVLGFIGGMCFTLLASTVLSGATTIYNTAMDIPSSYFKEQKSIDAVVVRISDGDTFRVRHVTRVRSDPSFTGKLSDNTIVVRIAAVDTPETAKFGNAGQAYADEAKKFVTANLLNHRVSVQLLSRDQYGRVVGLVKYNDNSGIFGGLFGGSTKDISEELLKQGLAVVYRQGGAQYGGSIAKWNELEQQAMKKKLGIWKKGVSNADLPADYKKKTKANTNTNANTKQHAYL